jgi:DNA polymerase III polC-type N-terminus.
MSVVPQLPLVIWVIESTSALNSNIKTLNSKQIQNSNISNAPSESPSLVKEGEGGVLKKEKVAHSKFTLDDLHGRWGEILKKVKPMNHSIEALLRSTKPLEFDGERLVLEVFYQFHYDKLNTDKCRQIVEQVFGNVFEVPPVKLFMKLGKKEKNVIEEVSAKGVDEEVIAAAEAIFNASAI